MSSVDGGLSKQEAFMRRKYGSRIIGEAGYRGEFTKQQMTPDLVCENRNSKNSIRRKDNGSFYRSDAHDALGWSKTTERVEDFKQTLQVSTHSRVFGASQVPGTNQRKPFDAKMMRTTDLLAQASIAKMNAKAISAENGNTVWGSNFDASPNSFKLIRRRKSNGTFYWDQPEL